MDYKHIESLIISTKAGDTLSLENPTEEFTPLIKNICRKTHLPGYIQEDPEQECIISLMHCIEKYTPSHHKFVAYATNGIKNNLNYLIKKI